MPGPLPPLNAIVKEMFVSFFVCIFVYVLFLLPPRALNMTIPEGTIDSSYLFALAIAVVRLYIIFRFSGYPAGLAP